MIIDNKENFERNMSNLTSFDTASMKLNAETISVLISPSLTCIKF